MQKVIGLWTIVILTLAATVHSAEIQPGGMGSGVEDLGDGRYRIGAIEVNKAERSFTVSGTVLPVDTEAMPIEFLAVTRDGVKAYEAAIELESSAIEFNTACILIGLDAEKASHPEFHFDPKPVRGDPVSISVSWEADGTRQTRPLIELILNKDQPADSAWVYTGSLFNPDGSYIAEELGTLIGVVHDPDSIIQHRTGLGLGDYGAVTINPEAWPGTGTVISLTVKASR